MIAHIDINSEQKEEEGDDFLNMRDKKTKEERLEIGNQIL